MLDVPGAIGGVMLFPDHTLPINQDYQGRPTCSP